MRTFKVYVTPGGQPFTLGADDAAIGDGRLDLMTFESQEKAKQGEYRVVASFATWVAFVEVSAAEDVAIERQVEERVAGLAREMERKAVDESVLVYPWDGTEPDATIALREAFRAGADLAARVARGGAA
jgi:hypothetical protein